MPFACSDVFSSDWQGALCSSSALLQGAAEDMQQTDDSLFIGFLFDILLYTLTLSMHFPFIFLLVSFNMHKSFVTCTLCIQRFMYTFVFYDYFCFNVLME